MVPEEIPQICAENGCVRLADTASQLFTKCPGEICFLAQQGRGDTVWKQSRSLINLSAMIQSLPKIILLAVIVFAQTALSAPVIFVQNGDALNVSEASGGWKREKEYLVAEGVGTKLVGGLQVGPGDFEIRTELILEKMDRSAAAFKLGDSWFGFAGAHGKIFLTGSLFNDAQGTPIGDPEDYLTDGKPFVFEAIREERIIRFLIDGQLVYKQPVSARAIGEIGFTPSRSRMKIKHFSVSGNLADHFEVPVIPPYRIKQVSGVEKIRLLPPAAGNARNSEGDFIRLKDGRILFIYTHFTGGGSDHAAGHLAGRYSLDGGRTWTSEDIEIVPQSGGFNDMSVSLLRLQDGRIALFYARKNSLLDCRPVVRFSDDEATTWSEPIEVITDQIGYYVLNNDRVIQLKDGRLILAVALHNLPEYSQPNWNGHVMCYLSDDAGKSWRRNQTILSPKQQNGDRLIAQEPGLIELKDGRLMMFIRSNAGSQLFSFSKDRGETWSEPEKSTLQSPVSPATIERVPTTGDLLVAWNNHENIDEVRRGRRTPFNVAISRDEGETWTNVRTLEDDPNGWYCYTAMDFEDEHVLLGHCAGDRRLGGLNLTQVTRFPIDWLYESPLNPQEQLTQVRTKLEKGEPVRIVCLGDSVTGLYYHTGGRRTYTDMLGIALRQVYPQAKIEMINAGVSGNTTVNALARIKKDVLDKKPDLVTVMFGLNDMTRVSLDEYEKNLRTIANHLNSIGAAIVFCTPNAVISTERRPVDTLRKYCEVVRNVSALENIPLCDCFWELSAMRAEDPHRWRLIMSDEIHPNMAGHKRIAELLTKTISSQLTSLSAIGPPQPALTRTPTILRQSQPLKVLAMHPLDSMIAAALDELFPVAEIQVTPWETKGKTLVELPDEAAKSVRKMRPDLVLLTIPKSASAQTREELIHSVDWLVNYSLSFGQSAWDCVIVHPSLFSPNSGGRDELIRELVANHDLHLIDRTANDERPADEIIKDWLNVELRSNR